MSILPFGKDAYELVSHVRGGKNDAMVDSHVDAASREAQCQAAKLIHILPEDLLRSVS